MSMWICIYHRQQACERRRPVYLHIFCVRLLQVCSFYEDGQTRASESGTGSKYGSHAFLLPGHVGSSGRPNHIFIMKKSILYGVVAAAALSFSSCSTISHTATTMAVDTSLTDVTTADLQVSDQVISYTFTPSAVYRRAGEKSVKAAAVAKALEANGGGDVLVAPQFEVKKYRGLFSTKITSVTVKGHPATYKNFHPTTKPEAETIGILSGAPVIVK